MNDAKKEKMNNKFEEAISALYKKDLCKIEEFLKQSDILEAKDKYGRTLLFYAIIKSQTELVRLIVSKNANINIKDKVGWTPLHYAVDANELDICKILIKAGADVHAKDSYGNNIISRATFASKGEGDIIKLLLSHGSDPNLKNDYGVSALDLANLIANYDIKKFFNNY